MAAKNLIAGALLIGALLIGAFQASAAQVASNATLSENIAAPAMMLTANRTSQPIGHFEYCQINVADCSVTALNTRPMRLTRKRWKEMIEANAHTNASVIPVTDIEYYGVEEIWNLPDSHGDCEDYVLLKRQTMMQQGWPASSLLVTVVRRKNGDGHAVLTVRTDKGDFILDNLKDKIELWNNTDYTYLKRVSAMHSGWWEDIIDNRNIIGSVSSVK